MDRTRVLRTGCAVLGVAALVLARTADWLGPPGTERQVSGEFMLTGLGLLLVLCALVLSRGVEALGRRYSTVAVVLLNTLLLFLVANTVLAAAFFVVDVRRMPTVPSDPLKKYGMAALGRAYPGWTEDRIEALFAETFRPFAFEPYTLFRETPRRGRYVTVDPQGFRHIERQGPWPPDTAAVNVFVFGGSTVFGYGLTDAEAIPSHLQAALARQPCGRPVRVYNFGRGFYYSTQERILFQQLLSRGLRPDLAIFIDGLNDASRDADVPDLAAGVDALFQNNQADRLWLVSVSRLPVIRAVRRLARTAGPERPGAVAAPEQGTPGSTYEERVVERLRVNRVLAEAAGSAFGVPTLFVWQPVPVHRYDLRHHPFMPEEGSDHRNNLHRMARVYRLMEAKVSAGEAPGVLWLGGIQERRRELLYVDAIHYTAAFSRVIAEHVARHLAERGLVCAPAARG